MGPSIFQFSNPLLISMSMEVNRRFTPSHDSALPAKFKVDIEKDLDKREAIVELTVEIGMKDPSVPYFISVTEGAKFRWSEEADDKIESLLNQNAPALLLGYIRPIVASVTVASPFEAYNIPFIDFTAKEKSASQED